MCEEQTPPDENEELVARFEGMAEQIAIEFGLDAVQIVATQETQTGYERMLVSGSGLRHARVNMCREFVRESDERLRLLAKRAFEEDAGE